MIGYGLRLMNCSDCYLTAIKINQAGSIAEASLQLNQVFEAAQQAAEQYLENIRSLSGRQEQVCQQIKAIPHRKVGAILPEVI